jgi:hypothetical protein
MGGEELLIYLLKRLLRKYFGHKNTTKHENRGTPLDFITTPSTVKYPLKRI